VFAKNEKTIRNKLVSKISANPKTGCWEWSAGKFADGYGAIWTSGTVRRAHRVSYEIHCGSIPDGLHVLHRCDNPICINPEHLFLGTNADNAADKTAKGRQAREARLPQTKLSDDDVRTIRASSGATQNELAERYGVDQSLISHIRRNKVRPWL
jgi:DNA-binding transcriptional regulator YiaG